MEAVKKLLGFRVAEPEEPEELAPGLLPPQKATIGDTPAMKRLLDDAVVRVRLCRWW